MFTALGNSRLDSLHRKPAPALGFSAETARLSVPLVHTPTHTGRQRNDLYIVERVWIIIKNLLESLYWRWFCVLLIERNRANRAPCKLRGGAK